MSRRAADISADSTQRTGSIGAEEGGGGGNLNHVITVEGILLDIIN